MKAWFFLFVAASFEAAWTYSVKYMAFSALKTLRWNTFYVPESLLILLPFFGYIVFGLANVYFFAYAIEEIPITTAFAVWTAVAMALIKLVDVVVLKTNWSVTELFFLTLIGIGIIGLHLFPAN